MTLKSMSAASPARIEGSAIQSLPAGITSLGARASGVSRGSLAAVAADAIAAASRTTIRFTLLPLDRARRLRRIVVNDAVDAVYLIDDARRDAAQELGIERINVSGHSIDAGHRAQAAHVIVGPIVTHHSHRAH